MSATDGIFVTPRPVNEPVLGYAPGSSERAALEAELASQASTIVEIPCVVGGEEIRTGKTVDVTMPCDHGHVLAKVHLSTPETTEKAVGAARAAHKQWSEFAWQDRLAIIEKAAELLAGPWRWRLNAATMLGQAKTCHQAEIDSSCELIDFWRFNANFARQIYAVQPESAPGLWNRADYRSLEGFVLAVTPFNFTAIALNLPTAPAIMGNTVIWKPSLTQNLAAWHGHQLLREAGMPPGVINLLNGHGADVGDPLLAHRDLAGVHFTGSTPTFQHMWKTIGNNIAGYRAYPRIVGETGGKDFIVAHPSADPHALSVAIIRGAFEYQGQKCSAASRLYVPKSLWPQVKEQVTAAMSEMKMGDVRDFSNYVAAVIDERAFDKHASYLEVAKDTATIAAGGECDKSTGWFVQPTLVEVTDPKHRLMQEEIFGPIVTAFVYDDSQWTQVLDLVDSTSPYALTGAVFAQDRYAVAEATRRLRHAAGNYYINDKPTGAVVNQQPFGGGRASGTNDKAGSVWNLMRWVSPRSIKETLVPATKWRYPFLG